MNALASQLAGLTAPDDWTWRAKPAVPLQAPVLDRATGPVARIPFDRTYRSTADVIRKKTGVSAWITCPTDLELSPPLELTEAKAVTAVSAVASVLRRVRPDGSIR